MSPTGISDGGITVSVKEATLPTAGGLMSARGSGVYSALSNGKRGEFGLPMLRPPLFNSFTGGIAL